MFAINLHICCLHAWISSWEKPATRQAGKVGGILRNNAKLILKIYPIFEIGITLLADSYLSEHILMKESKGLFSVVYKFYIYKT